MAAGLMWGGTARAGEPAPVAPGLWEVQMLALFQPDPQPGASEWPGLPGKSRARVYRICLDAPRAKAPMGLPQGAEPGAVRVVDEVSVLVRDNGRNSEASEILYRRLSEREFEGSQTIAVGAGRDMEMTLQYRSVFVQRDCDGVRPTTMSKFGEP
jgi:hypothetical protein